MIRVLVICEGQTEETFIRDVISPILANQNVFLTARLIQTSKGQKGGALSYERVRRFVIKSLKEDNNIVVTTFFDLYALHSHFPSFHECQKLTDLYQKVEQLEQAFKNDIVQDNETFVQRFLPYIQPYEFEGLLFTDIEKLTGIESDWKKNTEKLKSVRTEFTTPEHINDGYETKPSARLTKYLNKPKYRKSYHGVLAIKSVGINKLLEECKHFQRWYLRLSNLSSVS